MTGKIVCVGLGPGDPELMSVRADRLVRAARHVAYFRKAGRRGQARTMVEGMLRPDAAEHPLDYPVTTEIAFADDAYNDALAAFYDGAAERLAALARTDDVVVLCEGDPLFYGSFMHLLVRLEGRAPVEIVPGVTGMSGCWTAVGRPMTWGDDVLTVLPATLPEEELARRLADADAFVVMKVGQNLAKVRRALQRAGRLDATYVERGTMPGQKIRKLAEVADGDGAYFSVVLSQGDGRRPRARGETAR